MTIEEQKSLLQSHPVFEQMTTVDDLKLFMEHHVVCVWDFMQLVKSLQSRFCPVQLPWLPPTHALAARLMTEIVLEEETDIDWNGAVKSHLEMYLDAMDQVGADSLPMRNFLKDIAQGTSLDLALRIATFPDAAKMFCKNTLDLLKQSTEVQLQALYHTRENLIPEMFDHFIEQLPAQDSVVYLRYYLQRHVELDAEQHGPKILQLLEAHCVQQDEVEQIVGESLRARQQLWDSIYRSDSVFAASTREVLHLDPRVSQ